jgi:hypothetical protein
MGSVRALATLALGVAGLAATGTAQARIVHDAASSTNWSGYAVSGSTFTDVKGTWMQPAVTCAATGSTYAAFWVGLGGLAGGQDGLEQIGTQGECQQGKASYSVWYELLPAAAIMVPMAIAPGDTVSAEVSIDGSAATLAITDGTSGRTFTTTAIPSVLDTSSAEWIAEAPSQCFGSRCLQLTLANFGSVQFSGASTTANGHVGTISDASWSATAIDLGGNVSAAPEALTPDGAAFTLVVAQVQTVSVVQTKPKAKVKAKAKPKPKGPHRPRAATPAA